MTLFETYEPHPEYLRAVMLRPENFDELANELSKWGDGMYLVGKVIRYGEPQALTLTRVSDSEAKPLKCPLFQMIAFRPGDKVLKVMDRGDVRGEWRLLNEDPYA